MTAIIFLTLFSALMAILGDIFILGSLSPVEITQMRTDQTREFFENVGRVVTSDISPNQMQAISATTIASGTTVASYISNNQTLAMMGSGNFQSPAVDGWGNPIQGVIRQEKIVMYGDSTTSSSVVAPVTSFALVSKGLDNELSPTLVNALAGAQTTTAVMAIGAYTAGNAIIYTFNDLSSQQTQWERIKKDTDDIVKIVRGAYQQSVLAASDPSTVPMPDFSNADMRRSFGVQTLVDEIVKPMVVAPYGHLDVIFARSTTNFTNDTLTITVKNNDVKPTPWVPFNYVNILRAGG